MSKLIVGVDPDVEKSGYCALSVNDKKEVALDIESYNLPDLLAKMHETYITMRSRGKEDELIMVVEAGWMNKSNWHLDKCSYVGLKRAAKLGLDVGRNHQIGRDIVDICRAWGIKVIPQPPLAKTWRGKDHKITHQELAYFAPINKTRTNQEERDATLLAWSHAHLPIKVKAY